MSLAALQGALAELFVDPGARDRFARDPAAFAGARGLTRREREQLAALSAASVASYAATLVRKRRSEVAHLLPRTRAALGEAFDDAFARWAPHVVLREGAKRYAWDALAFSRSLLSDRSLPSGVRAAIRRDRADLRPAVHPVAALLRNVSALTRARVVSLDR